MGEHNTSGEGNAPKPIRFRAAILPAVGLVAVLVGVVIAWSNDTASASFGWFAYAPLSEQIFMGDGVAFVSQGMQVGLTIAVLGLLVLAFWAGYRIGRQPEPEKRLRQW